MFFATLYLTRASTPVCLWPQNTPVGSAPPPKYMKRGGALDMTAYSDQSTAEPGCRETEEIVVDWYRTTDPENPHNWPVSTKLGVASLIK